MPNNKGSRKAHGEAHVRRRADGVYEAQVALGYHNGKRLRKSIYGKTEAEVVKKKTLLLAQYGLGGLPQPEKLTVEALMLNWLEGKQSEVKPTTHYCYSTAVYNHIIPKLGKMLVQKLEVYHLEDFYRALARSGLKRNTIKQCHVPLYGALKQAKRGKIILSNPAEDAELPREREPYEAKVWTVTEARDFLTFAAHDRLFALYYLALLGSFRKGELLGLKWSAISLEEHPDPKVGRYVALRVINNRVNSGSKVLDLSPKTHRSRRPVVLPMGVWDMLMVHKSNLEAEREALIAKGYTPEPNDYVFLTPLHQPWNPSNFYNREWLPLLKKAGVSLIRFHDMRHTNITLDLHSGGDLKTASQRAGHATAAFTASVYVHPDVAQHLQAASRIAGLLSNPQIKPDRRLN